ncbi:unnamed protein product [Rhizophagus irregularis]|uniref:G-protein coupled receptors family 1 profile domain-containing protein n=1 Tax=Rhizophagus irregularis TaxID=588596 RepID=A0A2N1NHV5_9GLOM|nr:hypothetical protein RhiirC2_776109 [Rhizophagus irregularis]CAB5377174.1 unnamed protein product [Rhizophagus irregularis]
MNGLNDTMITTECRWEIKIEGCKDASFFRIIIGITLTLHIIVFIISTSLLLYRKIRCNGVIWNGQCFTALDGFLFWADIWCIGRIIFIIDQLGNFTKGSIIFRYILFEIMAFPPIIAVATYTSGLFYAIPRINFNRHSITQEPTTPKQDFIKNQIYLPRPHVVSHFYWIFVIFFFIMTFVPLIIAAIAEQNNNDKLKDIFWPIHFLTYAISFGLLTIVLTYYGRMLVRLTEKSVSLSNDEFEKQKYKIFLYKIRLFNVTLSFVFILYILGLTIFALWRKQIYSYEMINKIFAFMIEIMSVVAALIIVCALFYNEIIAPIITLAGPNDEKNNDPPISDFDDSIIISEQEC